VIYSIGVIDMSGSALQMDSASTCIITSTSLSRPSGADLLFLFLSDHCDKIFHGVLDQGCGCLLVFDEPEVDVSSVPLTKFYLFIKCVPLRIPMELQSTLRNW
jgi:hypothetical protein